MPTSLCFRCSRLKDNNNKKKQVGKFVDGITLAPVDEMKQSMKYFTPMGLM